MSTVNEVYELVADTTAFDAEVERTLEYRIALTLLDSPGANISEHVIALSLFRIEKILSDIQYEITEMRREAR